MADVKEQAGNAEIVVIPRDITAQTTEDLLKTLEDIFYRGLVLMCDPIAVNFKGKQGYLLIFRKRIDW